MILEWTINKHEGSLQVTNCKGNLLDRALCQQAFILIT